MTLTVAIVGLGVVGGSYAKALKRQTTFDVTILGIDQDKTTLNEALKDGVISYGETHNQTILQKADVVIIALYPFSIVSFLNDHQHHFKKGAIVTDTVGVKGNLISQIKAVVPDTIDYISGHPMAGKENKGYAYASWQVFQNANYLLTPTSDNKSDNIQFLTDLIKSLGFKRVTLVSPTIHDEMIAYTSQLPHAIAVALINSDDPGRETVRFIGDSYRELTRISKINANLWSELFHTNKLELLKAMEDFSQQFDRLKTAIAEDNVEALTAAFTESSRRRQQLEDEDLKSLHES
ncbi:MAG: prephenate dehydrogenase [Bavariicoccus seileri]|uniref:prephenate dehydrogenase n=1 Tax=Bavariicoccus seileri TaxID=549685 RepID=UPI0003B42BDC|nr:prephenate dehydrogenase [Bavariicoccus seileri]